MMCGDAACLHEGTDLVQRLHFRANQPAPAAPGMLTPPQGLRFGALMAYLTALWNIPAASLPACFFL